MRMLKPLACVLTAVSVASCVTDSQLVAIDPYYMLHDNSSKVWLINHCYKNGKDYAPLSNKYKEIITFYESSNCYVQPMNTFGDEPGRKGNFRINGRDRKFSIDYPDEAVDFRIKMLTEDKIILVPEGEFPYTLELIPVPEP